MKDVKVQDAINDSWVDVRAPLWARPYLRLSRLDRPVGAWLLFLPCAYGAILASTHGAGGFWSVLHVLIVCALGSLLMRGAGCTWNDIVDRKIDAQVERTRSRPLPSGQVSVQNAVIWMVAQMVIAGLLLLTFRWEVIWLTLVSLVIVAAYPFAKRVTHWPQVVLGLAFNWGVLVAWYQVGGVVNVASITLYIAMVIWTVFYDTIYAFQDIEDDVMIGVKSSAQAVRGHPKLWLLYFIIGVSVALAICALALGSVMSALAFAVFIFMLVYTRQRFHAEDPRACLMLFRQNVRIGQIFLACLLIGYILSII